MKESIISIIVPLYKGRKYVEYWIDIIEQNCEKLPINVRCELILVNDYPNEKILINSCSPKYDICVLNSEINRGIHGARVYGLSMSKGEYICFIDQDDKISNNYLISQFEKISDNDIVIGNGYSEKNYSKAKYLRYLSEEEQLDTLNFDKLINEGNTIISPGLVLLRKRIIPSIWIENIMKYNGADDYLLWILISANNPRYSVNRECIYEHVSTGNNVSQNISMMMSSEIELLKILERNNFLSEEQIKIIQNRIFSKERKLNQLITIYDEWLYITFRGREIEDYLEKKHFHSISIYGMNNLGNRLYDYLEMKGICVKYGIDRNSNKFVYDIPIYRLEELTSEKNYLDIDAVIITTINDITSIKEDLHSKGLNTVLSFQDILNELAKNED